MKSKLTPVLLLVLVGSLFAQSDSDVVALSPFEITTDHDRGVPAISLKRRADFVAVSVSIVCSAADAHQRIDEYQAAVKAIGDAVARSPHLRVMNGEISLSTASRGRYFGVSSLSKTDSDSNVSVQILGTLTDANAVFERAAEIRTLVDGIKFSKQIKVALGQTSLGVTDPEQYRGQLVKMIAADLKMIREALGETSALSINGLDGRVQVRQADEQNVRLYISYSYSQISYGSPEIFKGGR